MKMMRSVVLALLVTSQVYGGMARVHGIHFACHPACAPFARGARVAVDACRRIAVALWAYMPKVSVEFTQPGKPAHVSE